MAATMPPATAWRASSALDQWVMCSPSAIGSRQANSTIRARCRGGNLQRVPGLGLVQQEALPAALLVAAADAPDGGGVAPQPGGDGVDRLAAGDRQGDAGVLHLVEGQMAGACNRLEDRDVRGGDTQGARLPAAHGRTSCGRSRAQPSAYRCSEFLALLAARATRAIFIEALGQVRPDEWEAFLAARCG